MDQQHRRGIATADDTESDAATGYFHEAIVRQRPLRRAAGQTKRSDQEQVAEPADQGHRVVCKAEIHCLSLPHGFFVPSIASSREAFI
jgi:hypothetical protein